MPVWRLDRLARITRHLLMALEAFDRPDVRFVSVGVILCLPLAFRSATLIGSPSW